MKRRTLDLVFSIGGLIFSVLLLIVGLVLVDQANFAKDYVAREFAAQQITFPTEDRLRGEQDDAPCLIEYAGLEMSTGKQAECYASEYIAFHMAESATEAGYPGATYATLGGPQRELRGELTAATEAGQPTEAIQEQLDAVDGLRDTMFRGETLRGLLLTTYGFSIFGERAEQAALVVFIAAALLALLSIAGIVHAFTTGKDEKVLIVAHEPDAATART